MICIHIKSQVGEKARDLKWLETRTKDVWVKDVALEVDVFSFKCSYIIAWL